MLSESNLAKYGFYIFSSLTCFESISFGLTLKELKPLSIEKPGFLFSYEENGQRDLLVSSFAPFGKDKVFRVKNPLHESPEARSISVVTDQVMWPNEIKAVPNKVMGEGWVSIAGGFLVPGKGQGDITLVNMNHGEIIKLTHTPNFFYHRVEWHDMNQDGRLDIVTARANKPMMGRASSEMLWLEQPEDAKTGIWSEHVMLEGPDVFFRGGDLNRDGALDFVVAEFFSKKLSFVSYSQGEWKKTLIDDTLGAAFDLSYVDLNRDGRDDLLVTNHEGKSEKSAVFAYEIPQDINQKWIRHVLLTNIPTTQKGVGQASPGEAIAFSPSVKSGEKKPWIAVAGDGSQKLWLLEPASEEKNNWTYSVSTPVQTSSTIGRIEVADLDQDGFQEIYVPAYDANQIYTLKFTDKK